MSVAEFDYGPGKALGFFERRRIRRLLYQEHFPKFKEICDECSRAYLKARAEAESEEAVSLLNCIEALANSNCKEIVKIMTACCPDTINGLHDLPFQICNIIKFSKYPNSFIMQRDFEKNAKECKHLETQQDLRHYCPTDSPRDKVRSAQAQHQLDLFFKEKLIEISLSSFANRGANSAELFGNTERLLEESDPDDLEDEYQIQLYFRRKLLNSISWESIPDLQGRFLNNQHGWMFQDLIQMVKGQFNLCHRYLMAFDKLLIRCKRELGVVADELRSSTGTFKEPLRERVSRCMHGYNRSSRGMDVEVSVKHGYGNHETKVFLQSGLPDLRLWNRNTERIVHTARRYAEAWDKTQLILLQQDADHAGLSTNLLTSGRIINDDLDQVLLIFSSEFHGVTSRLQRISHGYFRVLEQTQADLVARADTPNQLEIASRIEEFVNLLDANLEVLKNNTPKLGECIKVLAEVAPLNYLPQSMADAQNEDWDELYYCVIEEKLEFVSHILDDIDQRNPRNL